MNNIVCIYIASRFSLTYCVVAMAEFQQLAIVKFKDDAAVEEIVKGMEKLASEIDLVKSFSWGNEEEGHEMLTQGFTHAFSMTFATKEDHLAFQTHPNHVEYSAKFSTAIEKVVVLKFSSVSVKPPPAASSTAI